MVESRLLEDASSARYMIILFSRRSRLHPGTRYIARGLNGLASPGNEIECEQVCHHLFQKATLASYVLCQRASYQPQAVRLEEAELGLRSALLAVCPPVRCVSSLCCKMVKQSKYQIRALS